MKHRYRQARLVWRGALPFGALLAGWGAINLWLYLQLNRTQVIPAQVASIWRWNIFVFVAAGLAGAIYFAARARQQMARLLQILEVMPCAVIVCGREGDVECCNSKAQAMVDSGILQDVGKLKNWELVETEIGGVPFSGLYTWNSTQLVFKEQALATGPRHPAGSALVLLDVTEWRKTAQSTKELADILQDLNQYLVQASGSFSESVEALAASTIKQALAFQELADYVYRAANNVELDACEIREALDEMTGNINTHNGEYLDNLNRLNESARLMHQSHNAAKEAVRQFEALKKEYGGIGL